MSQIIVAVQEKAVIKASEFLEIEIPEIVLFTSDDADKRNINSIFFPENYSVAFNRKWLAYANPEEILISSFHECRHAFQWLVVSDKYQGNRQVSQSIVKQWKANFDNYVQTTGNIANDTGYLDQQTEKDAITFSNELLLFFIK
ncbi:MAG: hypothetical protein JEZ05_09085 [Tenericutes bacterium]|nr:hypothetical protein [Mycoplasmatota bacterium]